MSSHLTAADVAVLLECLAYKEQAIRDRKYIAEDADQHAADYDLRQRQLAEVDSLKEKLRRIRDARRSLLSR